MCTRKYYTRTFGRTGRARVEPSEYGVTCDYPKYLLWPKFIWGWRSCSWMDGVTRYARPPIHGRCDVPDGSRQTKLALLGMLLKAPPLPEGDFSLLPELMIAGQTYSVAAAIK